MDKLVECIYCQELKKDSKFSLEHVIPQFLGGSQCPDKLKTREVCNRCNNNLGLFVDAAYQKEFATNGFLNNAYYAFFDPNKPTGLPLNCIGISKDLSPPRINKNEVCEMWVGPLGEQVFWIRPDDERMFWYSGGTLELLSLKRLEHTLCFLGVRKRHLIFLCYHLKMLSVVAGLKRYCVVKLKD